MAKGQTLSFTASGNLRGSFTLKETAQYIFEAVNAPQKLTLKFEISEGRVTKAQVSVAGHGPFEFRRH